MMSFSEDEFDDMKEKVVEALELFHIISLNLEKFADRIDKIIIGYYEFLRQVTEEMNVLVTKHRINKEF